MVTKVLVISAKNLPHVSVAPGGIVAHAVIGRTAIWLINQIGSRGPEVVSRKNASGLVLMKIVGVKSIVRIDGQTLDRSPGRPSVAPCQGVVFLVHFSLLYFLDGAPQRITFISNARIDFGPAV